ncbi:MAG: peptide ABC transporter substrate-binding protein [Candidatus Eremiobacteraeota bacterium]|nr:peptide ABC transporter substrate-binding protein [Candidatus Eremiobacteraeota bacterium]
MSFNADIVKRAFGAIALLVFAAACTRTGTGSSETRHSWTQAGVLRVDDWANPNSLNPLLASNTSDDFLAALAFDMLVSVDDKGNEVPDLAAVVPTQANGGIAKDGLTVTYHLRKGVQWQDGAPFSSKDVKFTWQAIMNPNNNVVERRGYDEVKSVDTPDANTVVFHLKEPFAPFVDTVFGESDDSFRILPEHLLAKYPDINHIPFNSQPIGTGPFKVVRWMRGDRVMYVANDKYFMGKPKLSRITVRFVTEDNTREADLRSHAADLLNDISFPLVRDLRTQPDVKVVLPASPAYESIDLNTSRAPLNDIQVRRSLAYGIDAAGIMRDDTYGGADAATEDLSSNSWAYDPNVTTYPYDTAKAAQLLESDGWKAGPDGIRVKNGKRLELQLAYGQGNPTGQAIGAEVQSQLRKAGVDVSIKTYNYTIFYATQQMGGILLGGKFDMAVYAWISGADPDDSQQFMCRYVPPGGNNISLFCNRQFDAAEVAALKTFDRDARKRAYATTQQLLAQNVPAVFLYYPRRRHATSIDMRGFTPNGITLDWNAWQWSI